MRAADRPVQLFGLEEAEEHQFYCGPVVDSPLELSPEKLFCVGLINQTAVFLDRAGGGVLGALEEGADWVDAEHFDQLAPSLETFFLERLATPAEYQRLALVYDELVEYDDWLKLLQRAGLAARVGRVSAWQRTTKGKQKRLVTLARSVAEERGLSEADPDVLCDVGVPRFSTSCSPSTPPTRARSLHRGASGSKWRRRGKALRDGTR